MIAIAIDDEPIALDIVKLHAAKVPFVDLIAVFTNAFEALEFLQKNKADLIFLDIKMPDISGIDFLKSLTKPPMVVFTTAYTEHAVQSFELDAIDYLLKPFSFPRFLKACNKANEQYMFRRSSLQQEAIHHFFVKDGYEQIKVLFNEILFIEAAGNYTVIHLATGKPVSTRTSIGDMELLLPDRKFIRIHRAYIVSLVKIDRFDRAQVTIQGRTIPIGAKYADCLRPNGG